MIKNFTLLTATLIIMISQNYIFSQWVELTSGVNVRLNSLSSIKGLTTWACGNYGTIIKSSNMGNNWQNGNPGGISANINLNYIYALNELKIFAAGYDGSNAYVYITIDGGDSWAVNKSEPNGKFNAIHFIDVNTGILTGNPVNGRWSVWKTNNGGANWDSAGCYLAQLNSEKGFSNSLWAAGNNIWFGTDNFRIYKTYNFGTNWQILTTGTEKNSASLWFDFDFNIGLTGSNNLLRTLNSGNNWSIETIPGSGSIIAVTGSAHSRINWAIRSDNKIYLNPHNTNIWEQEYTAPNGNYTYMTIERNGYFSGAVFALRDNGGISRTYFLALGINQISSNVPERSELNQNYPNPFNPLTKIRFSLLKSGNVKLTIFDVLGKETEVLLNIELQPGIYETNWNASAYPSGVYYYKLQTEKYSETRKMIYLK